MGITTLCRLMVECRLQCNHGWGVACLVRQVEWPGVPAVGMQFIGNAANTPSFTVLHVEFEHRENLETPPHDPPLLHVSLDGSSFGNPHGHELCGREKFIRDLQAMLDDGWQPFCDAPQWVTVTESREDLAMGGPPL